MAVDLENPFWDFSLAVYHRPGVAEACLGLQDRRGLDVNMLLFCCWAGSVKRRLGPQDMARAAAAVGAWQSDVIGPLRSVRRRLKGLAAAAGPDAGALRQTVKDCELEAERIEQALLYGVATEGAGTPSSAGDPAACAAANLADYLAVIGLEVAAADQADLEAILRGAFDALTPEAAEALIRG